LSRLAFLSELHREDEDSLSESEGFILTERRKSPIPKNSIVAVGYAVWFKNAFPSSYRNNEMNF
jgi:hypothetical protein